MHGKCPIIPMAAITGRPDRARIQEILTAYRQVGIDQFLMYPRTGLEIEYMSDEWMTICRNVIEVAHSLDMHVWLYDEYNFPSGNCRGKVTEGHDDYYPNALVFEKEDHSFRVRVVRNRIGSDILRPEVVSRFVLLTHERYYEAFAPYFGTTIQGMYTDEPSFAYYTRLSTFAEPVAEDSFRLPWYDGLEEEYERACGHDLREDVLLHLNGNTPAHLFETYYRVTGERMRTVFIGAIADWCAAHGIRFTGHLMEERADVTVRYNGNPLKMLSAFTLPGMDETCSRHTLKKHNMELSALSLVQYAGRTRPDRLIEMLAVSPTDMPLGEIRLIMWMAACFGVNHYLYAVAALDPKGNVGKPCYYFPIGPTSTNFRHYTELVRSACEAAEAASLPYEPEISLRFPSAALMRSVNTENEKPMGQRMMNLLESLIAHQVQYLYIDEGEESVHPIITMDEKGLFIEGEDIRFDDAQAFVKHLLTRHPRRLTVAEIGRETRDILVRRWSNGTVTLVDLSGEDAPDRILDLTLDGRRARVRLPGNGVFHGKIDWLWAEIPKTICADKKTSMRLTLKSDNLMRIPYTMAKPRFTVNVSEDIPGVRLIVRRDPDPVLLALDETEILCEDADTRLPDGFTQLYRQSRPFTLTKGAHEFTTLPGDVDYVYRTSSTLSGVYECVKAAPAAVDYRYMPAAFLAGAFGCDENGCVFPWTGECSTGGFTGAPHYVGDAELTLAVTVPEGTGRVLALDVNASCASVRLDGKALGLKCWAPYEWDVPDDVPAGEHALSVSITTSISPMFGDISIYRPEQPHWVSIIASGPHTKCGLMTAPVWKAR